MSLVTGNQPAEFIFVSSLQARHQKNDYIIRKTNRTNMTRKHLQQFWTAGQNKLLKQKQAAKENAVPKLHQKVSGDVSRHWNSARWIYLCFILANSFSRPTPSNNAPRKVGISAPSQLFCTSFRKVGFSNSSKHTWQWLSQGLLVKPIQRWRDEIKRDYAPENQHDTGKSPCFIGDASSNCCFFPWSC